MRQLHLLIILFAFPVLSAANYSPDIDPFILISKTENQNLATGKVEVIFRITGIRELTLSKPIIWSIDHKVDTVNIGDDHEFQSMINAGTHVFEFFYSRNYEEIFTSPIEFEAGFTYVYQLHFKRSDEPILVRKPVIYVYPESPTEVTLIVKPTGEMTFTYPALPTSGWQFKADPDGKLHFGDQTYRYLFWESSQSSPMVNLHNGSLIHRSNIVAFLEKSLTEMGLSSEEKADFITYWAPQMMEFNSYFIQFQFNDNCDKYAKLDIFPKPDKINRVYMIFKGFEVITDNLIFIPQEITKFDRTGFDVLEWGGFEKH